MDIHEEVGAFNRSGLPSMGANLANSVDDVCPSQVPSTFPEEEQDVFEKALVVRPHAPRRLC